MPSYHCFDNVSIEWNKGDQVFKLYVSELGGRLGVLICSWKMSQILVSL